MCLNNAHGPARGKGVAAPSQQLPCPSSILTPSARPCVCVPRLSPHPLINLEVVMIVLLLLLSLVVLLYKLPNYLLLALRVPPNLMHPLPHFVC
jgi:hypothetical protein